jgi:hypothetical protein
VVPAALAWIQLAFRFFPRRRNLVFRQNACRPKNQQHTTGDGEAVCYNFRIMFNLFSPWLAYQHSARPAISWCLDFDLDHLGP